MVIVWNLWNSIKLSFCWTILFCGINLGLYAQGDTIIIQEKVQQITVDPFSNIYIINDDFEFKKMNSDGKITYQYSDLELSEFSRIASDHSFKSLIYYPEFNFIRVFGNRLQVLAELNLNEFGFGEVTAVAPSVGYQSFWVFDATDQKLVKITQNYQIEQESELINILEENIFPTILKEREGWIYAYDPEKGLYIFDNAGVFSKSIPITGASSFSVFSDNIFISKDGKLFQVERYLKQLIPLDIEIEGEILELNFRKMIIQSKGIVKLTKF